MKKKFIVFILFLLTFVANVSYATEYSFTAIDAYNLGVQQTKTKAYNSAISSFKKAIAVEPTFADAYYNLASVYICLKQYDNAINAYSQLLKVNPNDVDAIFELAKICNMRQNYSTEIKYLSYIPTNHPKYSEAMKMKTDAEKLLAVQKQKYISTKVNKSNPNKKVIIDKFSSPTGIATDSKGNIYVACYSDNSIMKVEGNRKLSLYNKSSMINGPIGIAFDSFDNLYVANFEGNNILKINPQGKVYVFMNKVYNPYYLYIKNDILYISEQANNIVIKYSLK